MWAKTGVSGGSIAGGSLPPAQSRRADRIGDYDLEVRAPRAAGDILVEWRALERRAVEPNLFAGPDFLAAATTHLSSFRDLKVLLLWRGSSLEGAIPLATAPMGFASRDVHAPQIEYGCSGAPLVDAKNGEAVLAAACSWLSARHSTIVFEGLSDDSPFRSLLATFAERTGRRILRTEQETHVSFGTNGDGAKAHGPSADSATLPADADASLDRALDPVAIRGAVEDYLILEAQDAFAHGRPALIQQPGQANLVRTVTRQLGRSKQCQVFTLRLGGRAAASAIILLEPARARVWKFAADPQLSGYPVEELLQKRIARLLTRRVSVDALIGRREGIACSAAYRLALKPGEKPDSIARRLGERVRRSADNLATAAHHRFTSRKRNPAA
jgi:hypothetical protein